MINKLLIANRGEIAIRIIRTCQEMGIRTIVVYSDADKDSLAVEMADEAVYIGESEPSKSYLNMEAIIQAANRTNANAIHPGFGFLAENAQFAYLVNSNGFIFIGPTPGTIEGMGDKRVSKILLHEVPFVPGYIGEDQDNDTLTKEATNIGYPIMVKATAGGGGKGMRLVHEPKDLISAIESARREAEQAFGNGSLMLERAIIEPRHIEVQIFGDQFGNVVAVGERECSIQRRHQKIVEETPSSALSPELRANICDTAVNIARQIAYVGAGTVEFLLDAHENFYFMEMNTRLQVEHPVTEMVYGVDLVRWQIQVARGLSLDEIIGDNDLTPHGHAIEVRVYAEDPANHFLPVIGKVLHFEAAPHVRTDSGIRSGDMITPYYDPMIAKVIAWGETRVDAIRKLEDALARTKLLGLNNNIAYLRRILTTPEHLAGLITTNFVNEHAELLNPDIELEPIALVVATIARNNATTHWRNNPNRGIHETFSYQGVTHTLNLIPIAPNKFDLRLGDFQYALEVNRITNNQITVTIDGHRNTATVVSSGVDWWVHTLDNTYHLQWVNPLPLPIDESESAGSLRAPMPGKVIQVLVEVGQTVEKGTVLLILEAMKMEHRIEAPHAGIVENIRYQPGDIVQADEVLLALNESNVS
jgi:geranyl-CoA carboxylase alpha subunit